MRMHVVVVGAGVVGSAVALRLAGNGARVTLLDAREPGAGTSSTSFAWIGRARPRWRLPRAQRGGRRRVRAPGGGARSRGRGRAAPDRSCGTPNPIAARSSPTWWPNWRTRATPPRCWIPSRRWRSRPALRLAPGVEHVAFHADEGHADGRRMAAELAARAVDAGAEPRTGAEVTGVDDGAVARSPRASGWLPTPSCSAPAAGPARSPAWRCSTRTSAVRCPSACW